MMSIDNIRVKTTSSGKKTPTENPTDNLLRSQLTAIIRHLPTLIIPSLILATYAYLTHLYHIYDWGHAFTKLLVFLSLAAFVIFLSKQKNSTSPISPHVYWLEMIVLIFILAIIINHAIPIYSPLLKHPPAVDIGATTQAAATMLTNLENPYQSKTIAILGDNPKQWGYKYGPMMMVGYLPSAFFSNNSFKYLNLTYLALTIVIIAYLLYQPKYPPLINIATILFAATVLLIPERLWYELFRQGVNDIFPVLLLLIALLLIKQKKWLAVGLLAGLSFSTKFALALPFIVLLIRKTTPPKLYTGLLLGTIPLLAFFVWNPAALINNVFLFHLAKAPDSTSLYTITPEALHYIFPVIQLVALSYFVFRNYSRAINYQRLTTSFILLLIILEVTFKEIHGNHLIFFLPFMALIFSWYRYTLLNNQIIQYLNRFIIYLRSVPRQKII